MPRELVLLEDLVVIMLGPPKVGPNASKFPDTVDVAVAGEGPTIRMSSVRDFFQFVVLVLLMCHTHLMRTGNPAIARLHPFGGADEMLCLDTRIAEETGAGRQGHKFAGGHSFPKLARAHRLRAHHLAVIDLERSA